ncbi:MAG: spermidine synthase [Nitrospirae bacterium GWF2_44_13]|nr:MAG: spermidine synthase [Nitrospirae bacterium GWF2_44_13]OGW64653.1 MAG: spermidine synthase [Nitrospirae bacterium RIFOXYA2_FULL_44_9]OGW74446.1 MAG: spermidine synthase [Nitrospirae bacterium RIFOXYC2_FULL_44_7]HBG92794.1 spermidine synthase [Nitrospiraceae bacterium]
MIRFYERDPYSPIQYTYEVENILYNGKSKFQEIMVIRNPHFGKMLILDGVVQITERDEFFYHEMLTHVALHAHPAPKKVIVIGGGDGGVVREVLKHRTVEKVYFIEIDEEVINVSRKFFPEVACDVDDPRVEIKCMDGAEFIKGREADIDAVIVDSTDIVGFATSLFTKEFFSSIKNCLAKDGFYVTLSESLHFHKDIVIEVQETMKAVFPVVDIYTAPIATYAGNWWTFSIASKGLSPRDMRRKFEVNTKYYSDEIHRQAFLPKGMYEKLMQRKLEW